MSGTKAQQARGIMAGGRPARAEQRKPPGATSAAAGRSLTSALLAVPSTAGSQQRRPNARCAAVGEASEASRDADVTVAHAHAQRLGCLSARWAQTCAPRVEGHHAPPNRTRSVVFVIMTYIVTAAWDYYFFILLSALGVWTAGRRRPGAVVAVACGVSFHKNV
jgi:hypothetical protein